MATFTLRDLIAAPSLTIGGITLTQITNNGPTNVNTAAILIDTVEGADPGIDIYLDPGSPTPPVATRWASSSWPSAAPPWSAPPCSLNGYGFAAPETGGQAIAALTQGRRDDDNIGINLTLDNNPGAPDTLRGADDITGGPVPRFTFEYDMALNVPGTVGRTEIRFDLFDDSGGGGGGSGLPADFDGLQYIASYGDLIAAFGANRAAGEQHFLSNGQAEGRQADLFSETQYLRNYGDLQAAFGTDVNAATAHFITSGANEGRVDDAPRRADRRSAVHRLQRRPDRGVRGQCRGWPAALCQQRPGGRPGTRQFQRDPVPRQLCRPAGCLRRQRAMRPPPTTSRNGFAEGRNDFLI